MVANLDCYFTLSLQILKGYHTRIKSIINFKHTIKIVAKTVVNIFKYVIFNF